MVSNNLPRRPLGFVQRCEILGISLARGYFLLACSKDDTTYSRTGNDIDRGQSIPYDPGVLVREAFRLGIGLGDTAKMMEMTVNEIRAYGLPFKQQSLFPPPANQKRIHNLFPPEIKDHDHQAD